MFGNLLGMPDVTDAMLGVAWFHPVITQALHRPLTLTIVDFWSKLSFEHNFKNGTFFIAD